MSAIGRDSLLTLSIPPLVFVWLGERFPHWMGQALRMNQGLCSVETILISNSAAGRLPSVTHQIFLEEFYEPPIDLNIGFAHLAPGFRAGFWSKTTERFFVLKQFMDKFSLSACFHAETDNVVFDISQLANALDNVGQGLFCPRDSIDRGIASLIYINDTGALGEMLALLKEQTRPFANDMALLGYLLQRSPKFFSLPTENIFGSPTNIKWPLIDSSAVGGIFDAASVGQFLFGIEPRNTGPFLFNRFENENCGVNLNTLDYKIGPTGRQFSLVRKSDGLQLNLYNLHVHSKLFQQVSNTTRLKEILSRVNNNKKTLMALNIHNNLLFKKIMAGWRKLLKLLIER